MTPWHRFWFPHGDEAPAPTRDAALWTPQALADTQRALWLQATHAAEQWWRFWRLSWPGVPLQPPAGVVVSHAGAPPTEAVASPRAPTRRGPVASKRATRQAAAAPTKTRRSSARGK